ncbi:hypothetical protein CRE_03076 [Caenorhabditis remanei]|uniref:BTB domain-containing protein n=2 Tax=Caenorhabditis remanei TaxID=31234 RepID=E3LWF2_CAERE|nr:hypothetical protein CRE_03076 [Caenorhabditis remanei]
MRKKYSKNGVHTFENVVGHLAQREDQVHSLGSIGGYEWKLGLGVYDETSFRSSLICGNGNPKVKIGIRYYLKIKNSNEILQEKYKREDFMNLESDEVAISEYIPLLEVLNLKNGWLIDEKCTVEYGIQVESILETDGIWKFNFCEELFDCKQKQNMISFLNSNNKRYLHSHKQILIHNCPHYYNHTTESYAELIPDHVVRFNYLELCLQIAHGVQIDLSPYYLLEMTRAAQSLSLTNATYFIEKQLIWNEHNNKTYIMYAIEHDLSRFLAVLLKKVTPEYALELLRLALYGGIINSSEIKKMIVAKVLYGRY